MEVLEVQYETDQLQEQQYNGKRIRTYWHRFKNQEQAFRGLTKAAEEESRNEALQEQIDAQMKAAETNQAATLTT